MPLTDKGKKIMKSMQEQYGKKKGEQVFYASVNEGKITGVEKKEMKKASLGLLAAKKAKDKGAKGAEFLSPSALAMRLIGRKSGSPKKGEMVGKLSGAAVSSPELERLKKELKDADDKTEARSNLKKFLKNTSGAAVSSPELERIKMEMKNRKKGSPKKGEMKDNPKDRFGEYRTSKASKGKMMKLKGGGAAIRGMNFKGIF